MNRSMLIALALVASFGVAQARERQPAVIVGIHANQDGACNILAVAACEADLALAEAQTGHSFNLVSQYCHFTECQDPNAAQFAINAINAKKVPMYTWFLGDPGKCYLATDFSKHVYDSGLAATAAMFASIPGRFVLRPDPAMDSPQRRCHYDTDKIEKQGAEFVEMWDYIHDFMHNHGVTNASWTLAISLRSFNDKGVPITTWKYFDPGPGYYDSFATMIYNAQETPVSIQDDPAFLAWYNQVAPLGYPLLFSETGGLAGKSGERWLYSMRKNLWKFPAVRGLVYFDRDGQNGDYRLDTTTDAVTMGRLQQLPYFSLDHID